MSLWSDELSLLDEVAVARCSFGGGAVLRNFLDIESQASPRNRAEELEWLGKLLGARWRASRRGSLLSASRPNRRDHLPWPYRLELQDRLRRLIMSRCWSPPTSTSNPEGNRLRSRLHMESMK